MRFGWFVGLLLMACGGTDVVERTVYVEVPAAAGHPVVATVVAAAGQSGYGENGAGHEGADGALDVEAGSAGVRTVRIPSEGGAAGSAGTPSTGGNAGVPSAGGTQSTGGTSTGGIAPTTGGTPTGGILTGGTSTGGISSGGAVLTGGVSTGGIDPTGGTHTGGNATTGGTSTGGVDPTGGAAGSETGGEPPIGHGQWTVHGDCLRLDPAPCLADVEVNELCGACSINQPEQQYCTYNHMTGETTRRQCDVGRHNCDGRDYNGCEVESTAESCAAVLENPDGAKLWDDALWGGYICD